MATVTLATGFGASEGSDLAKVTANSCSNGLNRAVRASEQGGVQGASSKERCSEASS